MAVTQVSGSGSGQGNNIFPTNEDLTEAIYRVSTKQMFAL